MYSILGQRICLRPLRLMLTSLFRSHSIHQAIAEVDVRNVPSWKLLERVGFRRVVISGGEYEKWQK